jgi:hypothetical protein
VADRSPSAMTGTAAPATTRRPGLRGLLARRWPTLLAVALVAPTLSSGTPEEVRGLAGAMMLLPLWYVVIEALDRRRWTWGALVVLTGLYVLLRFLDLVPPALVMLGIALVAVGWAAVRGRLTQPSMVLQVAGLVAWSALVLAGLTLPADVALYVVAAGWFAHGLWDLAHLRADAGVARTAAEWCAVVDVLIPAGLVASVVL